MAYGRSLKIFSGNASTALTEGICQSLEVKHCESEIGSFSDGEIRVQILENIRGSDVFIPVFWIEQ